MHVTPNASIRRHVEGMCELSYNICYHSSIDMAPFEALYMRGCTSPIGWFGAEDLKPLGVDLVKNAQTKVKSIQAKLLASQSEQKEYAHLKVRYMTFLEGEQVLLKVFLMNDIMRSSLVGPILAH